MIKKILKIVWITALALILLLAVAILLGAVLRDEMLLSPWGTGFFVIASGSMEPDIPSGSIIFVTAVAPDEVSVRDVLTFFIGDDNTEVVTHRVVEVYNVGDEYIYTTRGDANNVNDAPLNYNKVIGRVSYTIPGSSFVITLLGNATYVGIAIVGVGAVLCFSGIWSGVRKRKKKEKNEISEGINTNEAAEGVEDVEDVEDVEAAENVEAAGDVDSNENEAVPDSDTDAALK